MELTVDLRKILDLGIALSGEKDYNVLLERILRESMEITGCDAGTLYVSEEEGLKFTYMRNKTMGVFQGGNGEQIDLPVVPFREENICAFSAIHKKVVNIADVYHSEEFDFKGPMNYDKITGYYTKSMLVIPLENHAGESLGVIQLINCKSECGEIIPFDEKYNYIIYSLASQAAVTLDNMNHLNDMKKLMNSIVASFTAAVDERTPYNANHTKNVARYTEELIDFINQEHAAGRTKLYFDSSSREQSIMAAYLHDVGKLIIPLVVMNKASRLDQQLQRVLDRFLYLEALLRIDYLEGRIERQQYDERRSYLIGAAEFVRTADAVPCVDDGTADKVNILAGQKYSGANGETITYITEEERRNLLIRNGTLNEQEREVMNSHVVYTSKILAKIHFGKIYSDVPLLAGMHHEFLDGSGYPDHLTEKDIPMEARLITAVDIYDSLVSADRPYKRAVEMEEAITILEAMADEGKLDRGMVRFFKAYIAEGRKERVQ